MLRVNKIDSSDQRIPVRQHRRDLYQNDYKNPNNQLMPLFAGPLTTVRSDTVSFSSKKKELSMTEGETGDDNTQGGSIEKFFQWYVSGIPFDYRVYFK